MDFKDLLKDVKTIAVVGLSDNPEHYSNHVAEYLQTQGFKIIPINPNIQKALGERAYPDLLACPKKIKIDLIDIFRKSEEVLAHVEEAIKRGGVKTVWMQEGVYNPAAERLAKHKGLNVVMDTCLLKAHANLNQ